MLFYFLLLIILCTVERFSSNTLALYAENALPGTLSGQGCFFGYEGIKGLIDIERF